MQYKFCRLPSLECRFFTYCHIKYCRINLCLWNSVFLFFRLMVCTTRLMQIVGNWGKFPRPYISDIFCFLLSVCSRQTPSISALSNCVSMATASGVVSMAIAGAVTSTAGISMVTLRGRSDTVAVKETLSRSHTLGMSERKRYKK